MSRSGVLTKICTYEKLSDFVNQLRPYEPFMYIETIEQRPYIRRAIEIPKTFLSMRVFGDLFELYTKPHVKENEYKLVFITDDTELIDEEYISLIVRKQRSFFLDKRMMGADRKLLIQYYDSEQYGKFMRWKGVI